MERAGSSLEERVKMGFSPHLFFFFKIYLAVALSASGCQFPTGLIVEIYDP